MSLKIPARSRLAFLSPEITPINPQTAHPAVLIVDDDPDILAVLQDLIEHEGFRVTGVSTCASASRQVETVDFTLVLLDIGLPDGDGLAVLETIQAIAPWLPVMFSPPSHHGTTARNLCPKAHSHASPNHIIAMSSVQSRTAPLWQAAHPRLSITSGMLKNGGVTDVIPERN